MFNLLSWRRNEFVFFALVVLTIFGVSFYQLQTSKMKTRDAQRKSDTELVGRALNAYYKEYQVYPPANSEGEIVSCGADALDNCAWGEGPIVDIDQLSYLEHLPKEPFWEKGYKYIYEVDSDRKHYKIYAYLEYGRDGDAKNNLTTLCGPMSQCRWYVGN